MRYFRNKDKSTLRSGTQNERHVRIEISDFVMRTFSPRFPCAAAVLLNVFVAARVS